MAFENTLVDPSITAEDIRDAVAATKARAAAFFARVSDEALRSSVE